MVYIPEGEFTLGSADVDDGSLAKEFGSRRGEYYEDERPVQKRLLKGFYIDKYEVTNFDYKRFTDSTGYPPPPTWEKGSYIAGKENHPVENVSWYDAFEYCQWAGKRLLTEEEWEKAARGPKALRYPWGMEFNMKKGNLDTGETAPVGSYPEDKSYYGVFDMGGNVMEWTSSWYRKYPGNTKVFEDYGEKFKILRGGTGSVVGHYNMARIYARSTFRHYYLPGGLGNDAGIRCGK
ncbi:MAG: formylglycine-generating enzyme family protein [Nitrospinota bacterium]